MPTVPFILRWVRDEIFQRQGWHPFKARRRTRFLDQRSLALACDVTGGDAYVMWGERHLWRAQSHLRDATAITHFLRLDSIADFVKDVLPVLRHPIVLVTLESDYSPMLWQPAAAEALLASEKISRWFCAQCDIAGEHEKLIRVPLGIPYPYRDDLTVPSNLLSRKGWRARPNNLPAFEAALGELVANRLPLRERPLQALADFAINNTSRDGRHGETRGDIAAALSGNPVVDIPGAALEQMDLYRRYARASFVVSPHGKGLDCYRTWEALLLGAIPIVKRSALDPIYADFPVVILDDWREITGANLARWRDERQDAFSDVVTRLSNEHWLAKIQAAARALS